MNKKLLIFLWIKWSGVDSTV